jgi:hypothetical protein
LLIALLFVLTAPLAVATLVAARRVESHTHRVYCMVVAGINALSVPVGTVLGIVTIVALMRPSVAELFEEGSAGDSRDGVEGATPKPSQS